MYIKRFNGNEKIRLFGCLIWKFKVTNHSNHFALSHCDSSNYCELLLTTYNDRPTGEKNTLTSKMQREARMFAYKHW